MENISSWCFFVDVLGYVNLLFIFFCWVELDSEFEWVVFVLEKLKEDCNNMENKDWKFFQKEFVMVLLKMDCQGLVVRFIQDFVFLIMVVEVVQCWWELVEKLVKVFKQQMDVYEFFYWDRNGVVDSEVMWKFVYDFLFIWSYQIGDSYWDVIQELYLGLDKMKNFIIKCWKYFMGILILVNFLDILRVVVFSFVDQDDFVI